METPQRRARHVRHVRRSAAVLAALAVLIAGCGGGDDAAFEPDRADGVASMPAPAPAPAMPPMSDGARAEVGFEGDVKAEPGVDGRAVVRTASIELIVDDGAAAVQAVTERTSQFEGHVAATGLSRAEDGTVSGWLTLRVPADRLDEFVDVLDALARSVPYRSIDESDVTMQLSDLDARLVNLRAFEQELRALLTEVRERDGTVEGLVAVADRLREVRTEIDMVEGQRTQLVDRVAMATVHVSVTPARSTAPVVGTWDLPAVVRDAIAATVRLAQLVVEGVVWFALTVLPALVVLALVFLAVRAVRRRRRTDLHG
jgi:hypothetical protein